MISNLNHCIQKQNMIQHYESQILFLKSFAPSVSLWLSLSSWRLNPLLILDWLDQGGSAG